MPIRHATTTTSTTDEERSTEKSNAEESHAEERTAPGLFKMMQCVTPLEKKNALRWEQLNPTDKLYRQALLCYGYKALIQQSKDGRLFITEENPNPSMLILYFGTSQSSEKQYTVNITALTSGGLDSFREEATQAVKDHEASRPSW